VLNQKDLIVCFERFIHLLAKKFAVAQ